MMPTFKNIHFCILIFFIFFSAYLPTFFAQELCVFNTNIINQDEYSPLVLKPSGKPEFLHPLYGHPECFMANVTIERVTMRLACPGSTVKFLGAEVEESASIEPLGYSMFHIPGHAENLNMYNFDGKPYKISCDKTIDPIITRSDEEGEISHLRSTHSRNTNYDKAQIGFQLNEVDFLPVIRLFDSKNTQLRWAQAELVSVIESKKRQEESFDNQNEFGSLLKMLFEQKSINMTVLFTANYQRSQFAEKLTATITDDNYIVPGQLISRDDLFYNPQRRSTYFFENTAPMWRSIRDGNWKLVGEAARKLADTTMTNFDLFAGSVNYANYDIFLNPVDDDTRKIYVPKILFRIVYEPSSSTRGIGFITVNDPYSSVNEILYIKEHICPNFFDRCNQLHPEFKNVTRGLTVCCQIKDLKIWDDIVRETY